MATGLDVLLGAPQPQTGLDVLMGAPPAPVAPTALGTRAGGVIRGVNDVQDGAAQWLYNMMPAPLQKAGDAFDQWTGYTKPGQTFNNSVSNRNADYEASRAANGRDGIDWMRALGAGGAQTGVAALTGGASLGPVGMGVARTLGAGGAQTGVAALRGGASPVGMGVASGASTPVTDMAPGSDKTFSEGAGKNIALGGAFGGALGGIGRGIAGAVSPQISAMARQLMGEGVQLTPGQMFGGMAKSIEDKLTSVPIVGDMIKGAQGRGVASLNTAAYGRVLTPLKEAGYPVETPKGVGREAVDSISNQVSDAYERLLPKLTTHMDPEFAQGVGRLSEMVTTGNLGEAEAKQFSKIMQTQVLDKFMGGAITGETLKQMESSLGKVAGQYRGVPLGGAVLELQSQLRALVQRSNPEYAGQLGKINEAFANLARVQTAAATQGASNGVFSAAQLAAAVKGGDQTVRDNAYSRGKTLMQDLSDPAKKTLTADVPNSGTSDRAMTAGALGALLSNPEYLLNPAVLGAVLPVGALYSGAGQRVLNAVSKPRSREVQALADALRKLTSQGAGPVSAGALTDGR